MKVWPFFVAHAQPPELVQPSERPFDHPSPSPQSAAVRCVALCKKRDDASFTQALPDRLRVITAVAAHTIRTMARSSALSLQTRDCINQREGLL